MKHILDSSFRYKPSFATDLRKTFERVRRQQRAADKPHSRPGHEISVVSIGCLKRANER